MPDFIKLELQPGEDARTLRLALAAHFKYERLVQARRFVTFLAAVMALPMWVEVGWPGLLRPRAVATGFALWATLGVVLVGVLVREYTWYRRSTAARGRRDRSA